MARAITIRPNTTARAGYGPGTYPMDLGHNTWTWDIPHGPGTYHMNLGHAS